jgi:hypothetical protein
VATFHSGDVKFGFRDLDLIFELDISNVWFGGGGTGLVFPSVWPVLSVYG